jgi:hypothetical protein
MKYRSLVVESAVENIIALKFYNKNFQTSTDWRVSRILNLRNNIACCIIMRA